MGVGRSICRGYQMAVERDYDFVISMDADAQYDIKILYTVIEYLQNSADVVTASQYHPESPRFSPQLIVACSMSLLRL